MGVSQGMPAAVRKQEQYLTALADDVAREIHDLALELRPATLGDLGLSAALAQYVELWSTRSKLKPELHVMGLERVRLPADLEITVYRLVQEALTNIAKHAHANHISTIVRNQPNQFSLIVEDDGVGFKLDETWESCATNGRQGLLGMQERLAAIGGTLEIETSLTHGTSLFIRVPLPISRK